MKKSKLFAGLAATFIGVFALALGGTKICYQWEGNINVALGIRPPVVSGTSDTMYYPTAYSEDGTLSDESLAKMLAASDEHDRLTSQEGSVLIKNEADALPLKETERRVTLFGRAVADPVYRCNSGGASLDSKRLVSLHDALTSQGFAINETLFSAYENSDTKRGLRPNWSIGEESKEFYTDNLKASYASDYNDVAIVMFARQGGEGNDLPRNDSANQSFLALHQEEKDLLKMIKDSGKFKKTILLINSVYPLELDFLDEEEYGIDAALWIGGTGLKGFNGVVDLLTGQADPSGHFVDTYASNSLSSAAVQNFGDYKYSNADEITADSGTAYVVEAEGIYVGYKYYETRYQDQVYNINNATSSKGAYQGQSWDYAQEISYPFGYGLSYSNFTKTLDNLTWNRETHEVTATVTVKNIGNENSSYQGESKCVVQLYVQLPYELGMAEKSAIQLIDFAKTEPLAVDESQTLTLTIDDYLFATYDENAVNGADETKQGCYVFDEGDYYFAIGENAHDALNNVLAEKDSSLNLFSEKGEKVIGNTSLVKKETLDTLDNQTYARSLETGELVYNKLSHVDINSYGDFVTYMTRDDWTTFPDSYDNIAATEEMKEDLEGFTYETPTNGTKYDSSTIGIDKDIDLYDMINASYDDPRWDDFLHQMNLTELCSIIGESFGQGKIDSINKNPNTNSDGPSGPQGSYQFGDKGASTQHVNEIVAASTFNKQILSDRGSFIGEDCLYVGTTQLWAPGANIHRTPFSGRNHEYYSEDSIMSYICSSYRVAAMQKKGVNTAIKHFCANDQETNRTGLSTFMTEQAFRQGPLKGFEGAFTEGGALSTMMSMVRIGCTILYEDEVVLKDVLRGEWGFKGVNITDSAISQTCFDTIDSLMHGTDTFNADAGRASQVQSYIVSHRDGDVLDRVLEVNKNFYYAIAHSNNVNGLTENSVTQDFTPWWKPALTAIDTSLGVIALLLIAGFITFTIVERRASHV